MHYPKRRRCGCVLVQSNPPCYAHCHRVILTLDPAMMKDAPKADHTWISPSEDRLPPHEQNTHGNNIKDPQSRCQCPLPLLHKESFATIHLIEEHHPTPPHHTRYLRARLSTAALCNNTAAKKISLTIIKHNREAYGSLSQRFSN